MNFFLSLYALAHREIIRFLRQPHRVLGAIGQPLLFWLLMGSGFGASFKPMGFSNTSYMTYFFPGVMLMILLFTAIFSTFSIIEDRNEGFLQGVLVSPVSRLSIVLGKILGGACVALIHASLFLLIWPFLGHDVSFVKLLELVGFMFLVAASLTSFGFSLAWRMDSMQGFHAIMMMVLLPMWFLSGAFFPSEGLPGLLKFLISANPLTYALSGIRWLLDPSLDVHLLPSLSLSLGVVIIFFGINLMISWCLIRRSR